jgi:hypothetical protein
MREENEGYAKLVTELNQVCVAAVAFPFPLVLRSTFFFFSFFFLFLFSLSSQVQTGPPADMLRCIQSLIGFFELDPNRVLDIILDAFETSSTPGFFVELLKLYVQCCKPWISSPTHMPCPAV